MKATMIVICHILFVLTMYDQLASSFRGSGWGYDFRRSLNRNLKIASSSEPLSDTDVWSERDQTWLQEANVIEYVVGSGIPQFGLLKEKLGLNISSELGSRQIIPHHLTTASDLFCNREVTMEQIEAVGFDMDWTLAQYNEAFDLLAFNGLSSLSTMFQLIESYPSSYTMCTLLIQEDSTYLSLLIIHNHHYRTVFLLITLYYNIYQSNVTCCRC